MKSRWSIYFKERFPLIPNLLVALGMTFSAAAIARVRFGVEPSLLAQIVTVLGGMVFLAQIRFMDELKDFEKDKIAHPDRPLPRGLFTPQEFSWFIQGFNGIMALLVIVVAFAVNLTSAAFFAIGTFYLYLMYREFFIGDWLSERPLLYAITHQWITYPMVAFVLTAFAPEAWNSSEMQWLAVLLIGAFFGFEIGRKLDPQAHPLLKTYLLMYGKEKAVALMLGALGVSVYAAFQLGIGSILGFVFLAIAVGTILLWKAPSKFKWIEGLVVLYLLACIWIIPFCYHRI